MSDNIEHIDVDHEDFESAPKALRDHVKKMQKALDELRAERDGFRNQINETALADVLTGFKNPGRVKKDLLADGIDPLDSEAVTGWISEFGDDYARGEGAPADDPQPQQQSPDADLAAQYQRLNPTGIRKPSDQGRMEALNSIPDDLTPSQMEQRLKELGL